MKPNSACEIQVTPHEVRLLLESVDGFLYERHWNEYDYNDLVHLLHEMETLYDKMGQCDGKYQCVSEEALTNGAKITFPDIYMNGEKENRKQY